MFGRSNTSLRLEFWSAAIKQTVAVLLQPLALKSTPICNYLPLLYLQKEQVAVLQCRFLRIRNLESLRPTNKQSLCFASDLPRDDGCFSVQGSSARPCLYHISELTGPSLVQSYTRFGPMNPSGTWLHTFHICPLRGLRKHSEAETRFEIATSFISGPAKVPSMRLAVCGPVC